MIVIAYVAKGGSNARVVGLSSKLSIFLSELKISKTWYVWYVCVEEIT